MTLRLLLIITLLCLVVFSCESADDVDNDHTASTGCVACHTDKELLAQVAEPLEEAGGETAGEG